ncbi:MAG: DUF47 domain-containing protein [Ignavibacteriales bacterium]|nr:DUF47 domain-containing protein [Ignavibacteriales bacterium]
MKLDVLIRKLLPHDDKFYGMFEDASRNMVKAAEALKDLSFAKSLEEREAVVGRIRDLEHEGDAVTHKIFSELNSTFVTPLDREDIHLLASAIDDIVDHIDGSATRFTLYKIKECPQRMIHLIDVLYLSIAELSKAISLIRDLHQFEELQKLFKKVNEYENQADSIFEEAIADLFENEKDPINLIKLKEVYVGLETATDKCEDAANVLEGLLIKHA